jgi:hypothetical protein
MIAKKHGMDNVPSYVYPNDIFCALDFDLPDDCESLGETPMFIKVVYPDGTAGKEASTTIGNLAKSGEIVAYQLSEGWVELRRKKFIRYSGPDRRHKRAY